MKKLFASLLLISSSLVSAQELHTFSNGEVADAAKINENFRILEEEFGLLSSAIPTGIGAVFDEEGYAMVSVDCTSNTDAFADAVQENQRVSKVDFKVSGSCSGFINITDQVVIISGEGTDGVCSAPAELSGLRVRQGVALIDCVNVNFFQIYDGAVAEAVDVSVGSLFMSNGALRFNMQERPLLTMGDPLVVGHSTLQIQPAAQFDELPSVQIPGRIDVADFSTVSISAVNFVDPTEVWAYRSSSFRCEFCTGNISDLYLARDSWATLGVNPENLEVQQLRLGPGTSLNYSDTVNIGSVTKLEFTSSSTPNRISNELSGCSAAQDGSSVVINCPDGTSGVLASEGTVVVYESGEIGEPEILEYPTGAVVVVDDNDAVLGEASGQDPNDKYIISFDTPWPRVALKNKDDSLTVAHGPAGDATVFYLDESCAEGPFAESSESSIILVDETFYWKVPEATKTDLLVGSYKFSESFFDNETAVITECITYETARVRTNLVPAAKYTMPDGVINAKYPVRLEQLP